MTTNEMSFAALHPKEILLLETANSTYRFSLTDAPNGIGKLSGGVFGDRQFLKFCKRPGRLSAGRFRQGQSRFAGNLYLSVSRRLTSLYHVTDYQTHTRRANASRLIFE